MCFVMKKDLIMLCPGLICLILHIIFLKTFLNVKVLCLKLDVDPIYGLNSGSLFLFNIEKSLREFWF